MIFAFVNGKKQRAQKGIIGYCPLCDEELIPKCGNYKIHHWSHKNGSDCDSWAEGETEWHLNWKGFFLEECQEVSIINVLTREKHRADIKTKNNMVIELQNSPIRDEDIENRTAFYGKMMWIVNGLNYGFASIDFFNGISKTEIKPNTFNFHYYGRSKLFEKWSKVKAPVFIDFNTQELYWIKYFDSKEKTGKVKIVSKKELIEKNGGMIPVVIEKEKSIDDKELVETTQKPNYFQRRMAYLNRYKSKF